MAVTLKDEKLLDSWSVIIENGAGKQDQTAGFIVDQLAKSKLPGVESKEVGRFKGFSSRRRDYLMVTNQV